MPETPWIALHSRTSLRFTLVPEGYRMARYGPEHKEQTRERIVAEARRLLRAHGPTAVAIAPLMQALGLTHGGFYAHFNSREALLNAAVDELCQTSEAALEGLHESSPQARLQHYVDLYMSTRHRDSPASGCPLSFLSNDVPLLGAEAQKRYRSLYNTLRRNLATLLTEAGVSEPTAFAASLLAEMAGALSIARAIGTGTASNRVLAASREHIKARLP